MAKEISKVIVDKITLVTKNERPAVEKAETRFSIFKSFRMFKRSGLDNARLESIQKILKKKVDDLENVESIQ